jgi:hypothetical protein
MLEAYLTFGPKHSKADQNTEMSMKVAEVRYLGPF